MSLTIDNVIALSQHLAWPALVLIALLLFRRRIGRFVESIISIRDMIEKTGEIRSLVVQLQQLSDGLKTVKERQDGLSESISQLKGLSETALLGKQTTGSLTEADLAALWQRVIDDWTQVRDAFRRRAEAASVPVSFFGTVGVREAADKLISMGLLKEDIADEIIGLSSQYQWMTRTTSPKSKWLNNSVVQDFTKSVQTVLQAFQASDRV